MMSSTGILSNSDSSGNPMAANRRLPAHLRRGKEKREYLKKKLFKFKETHRRNAAHSRRVEIEDEIGSISDISDL